MVFVSGRWLCALCDIAALLPQPREPEKPSKTPPKRKTLKGMR